MPKADQGVNRTRYAVIPRTLIFLTRDHAVLLLKGSPDKRLWANRYNGIGGHIEKREDVYTSARRELLEETGLTVDNLRLCGVVLVDAGEDVGISIFVFRGEYENGSLVPSNEGMLEWVPVDDLGSYPLVEDLPVLLKHILAMKNGDPPFAAQYHYNKEDELIITFGS